MISAEFAAITFASINSARVLAYIPQILRIARDRNGSPGLSCLTWVGFAVANVSTVIYSFVVRPDLIMMAVFGVNAVFCLAIVALTVCTRLRSGSFDGALHRYGACPADSGLPPPTHTLSHRAIFWW